MVVLQSLVERTFNTKSEAQALLFEVDHIRAVKVILLDERRDVWV